MMTALTTSAEQCQQGSISTAMMLPLSTTWVAHTSGYQSDLFIRSWVTRYALGF